MQTERLAAHQKRMSASPIILNNPKQQMQALRPAHCVRQN